MKNFITFILIISLFVSCSDREVQLPHTTNNDITEVLDVSPIYIFYDETKADSVDFNRNNMISTTNWLVNIDKRLTLKQVLPHLQFLQKKRHGDGMHKNENAKNYFTCFNPESKNLSFIEFTNTNFSDEWQTIDYEEDKIYLRVTAEGKLGPFNDLHATYDSFINYHDGINQEDESYPIKEIEFLLDENLSIQKYIDLKTELLSIQNIDINISNVEFIYK